jgi:uroporphyrinogen-III synthase
MRPLEGQRVALLESRKAADVAAMVRRLGGTPICTPSVREVLREADLRPVLTTLVSGGFDVVALLTAAASDALFAEADRQGELNAVITALRRTTLACRGPKPLLSLKRHGLTPEIVTTKPHTSDELLDALTDVNLVDASVLLLHYGERSTAVSAALVDRGARVEDLCLYDWALPEDVGPLERLIADTLGGRIDVMLFTSQIQFRHLLTVAERVELDVALTEALRDHVIVGAVGPVCSRALRAAGVVPDVMPASPNGPSLVQAVADYVSMFDRADRTPE